MLKKITLMTSALALMIIIGCGGPPTEEINKAKAAKATADAANAGTYAKDQYDAGTKAWMDGEAAVKGKEWDKAKKAYATAATQFDAAGKAAPAGHDAMKADLTARMAKLAADHNDKAMADMKKKMATMKKDDKMKMDKSMADCKANEAAAADLIAKDDLVGAAEKITADEAVHAGMMTMMNPPKKDAMKK